MSLYQVPENIKNANDLTAKLELLKNIKRSFSVYRIDCGSCNGCEIEIFASITPMWDPERFGFKLVANPRHADILVCTGPVTRQMYYPLLRAYEAAPDPKIVVALGACGSTGGIFHDAYSVWSGIDKIVPVDVYIPGCPPHPASIIYGLGMALGIIDQKLQKKSYEQDSTLPPPVKSSVIGDILFERDLQAEAKRLMSYIFGRVLFAKYMDAIKTSSDVHDPKASREALLNAIHTEEDPRYAECMALLHNDVYLKYARATEEFKIDPQKRGLEQTMIEVFKLTKRHMDENENLPKELKDIKVFSTCVGHGVGTIDFSEKVLEIDDEEFKRIVENSGDYVKFKIGNLSKYFEIEIFAEHAAKLIPQLCECELKDLLKNMREGYFVLRKDF